MILDFKQEKALRDCEIFANRRLKFFSGPRTRAEMSQCEMLQLCFRRQFYLLDSLNSARISCRDTVMTAPHLPCGNKQKRWKSCGTTIKIFRHVTRDTCWWGGWWPRDHTESQTTQAPLRLAFQTFQTCYFHFVTNLEISGIRNKFGEHSPLRFYTDMLLHEWISKKHERLLLSDCLLQRYIHLYGAK